MILSIVQHLKILNGKKRDLILIQVKLGEGPLDK